MFVKECTQGFSHMSSVSLGAASSCQATINDEQTGLDEKINKEIRGLHIRVTATSVVR